MARLRKPLSAGSKPWLLVLLVALLARMAIPQGYMVEAEAGKIEVSICGADGIWHIPLPEQQEPPEDDGGKACHFSGHSASATPPDGAPAMPVPATIAAAHDALRAVAMAPPAIRALPPARAPPVPV